MWRQWVLVGVSLGVAVILQVTLLSRLALPGSTPDLTVVTVIALALALGRLPGAVAGFAGGLLVAIAPPSTTALGVESLIYMALGFIAGGLIDPRDRTVPVTIGIVAGSVATATFVVAVLDGLIGRSSVPWDRMGGVLVSAAVYAALLGPLVVPGIGWLARKLEPVKATTIG
jgi:rod shape-determining protein MreD